METYSMSQIEVLTRISAHKLRIWERRYGFPKPMRTATNIRYYSDDQLKKLLNVGILNRNGYRISVITKMSLEEIHENVTNILTNITSEFQDEINALILNMLEYNEKEFQSVFQRSVIRRGFLETVTKVIYPFLNQIGILWGTNKLIVSQEHFITNLIRQKIISAIDALPLPLENAPSIALFLLDNEDHEIGLLLSSFIAKSLGWRVFYLGQRVPANNIPGFVEKMNPDVMLTLFIAPINNTEISKIQRVFNTITSIPLLVSGSPYLTNMISESSQYVHVNNPQEFIEFLKKYEQ
jgi:DNA-binding transcriptional MerR regulator